MITGLNNLVRLNKSQIEPAADVLARAFQDDPLFSYFFPSARERMNKSPHLFRSLVQRGVLYGEVYATSPNLEGVVVWLHSDKVDVSPWRMVRPAALLMVLKMGAGSIRRMMRFAPYAATMHKRHTPFRHWYLQAIGVDPRFQGKGCAGLLLKPMFARMDTEHLACYLETQNQRNLPIYQHYGFEVVEEGTIPGTETAHWAMLRP